MKKLPIVLILLFNLNCFGWGVVTHEHLTKFSLIDIVEAKIADAIAEHADEPDCYHDGCPPTRSILPFCKGAPSEKGQEAPCLHGHRIKDYLVPEDKRFYKQNMPGAEEGAAYWATRAKEVYRKNPADQTWRVYLGWATHYLADALCPSHAFPETDVNAYTFWETNKFHPVFETAFENDFQLHPEIAHILYKPKLRGKDYIAFKTEDEIKHWIKDRAQEVYRMNIRSFANSVIIDKIFPKIGLGIRSLYNYVTSPASVPAMSASITATVLVMDVSGSMAWSWKGGIKIESAKKAALQFIEQVANEPRPAGTNHLIGVVTFSESAHVVCPLTSNYAEARKTVIGLGTLSSTNLGAGLDVALSELRKIPAGKCFIVLLSDGMTNTGKTRDQILATSVAEARAKGICIHTVGFGDPGDIDEDFLKKVAVQSGCGTYNYASSGFELFGTYIKVRHAMLGSNRIVDFSSGPSPVRLLPRQTATLGAFQLTAPAQELHFTLAWSEPGRMEAILVDPNNQKVTSNYPGVQIYSGTGFVHITVFSPKSGIWRASVAAVSSFVSGVQYYAVVSARTGGFVIPYALPTPCFNVLGTEICVPVPDLPTALIVLSSIAILAWVVYTRLVSP